MKRPVVIKNKPKNTFQCIWQFLTHAFQEAAIYTHTTHFSEVNVTSLLGLAAMSGVSAGLLQGAGAGKDPEKILTAAGCFPSPFSSQMHQARTFSAAANSHPGSIWKAELMLPSHIPLVMGSCLTPARFLSTPASPPCMRLWVYLKRKRDCPRRHQSRSPTWQHSALEPRRLLSACYLE